MSYLVMTAETDDSHLERAKALVRRFTFVLDMDCLVPSMQALAERLGLNSSLISNQSTKSFQSPKKRIGHKDVYRYLLEKNRLDVKLYKWARGISLVDCSTLK